MDDVDELLRLDLLIDDDGQSEAGPDDRADPPRSVGAAGDPPAAHRPASLQAADLLPPTFPGMEGTVDALTEAQLKSERARQIFEAQHDEAGLWMDDYFLLTAEGWTWRQAVYMLWESQPADRRRPRYQKELATDVLGLTTDRVICEWKADNPALMTRIRTLQISALEKSRAAIVRALVLSASDPDPRSHSDRKMALEMLGDYERRGTLRVGRVIPDDLAGMDEQELRALAYGGDGNG